MQNTTCVIFLNGLAGWTCFPAVRGFGAPKNLSIVLDWNPFQIGSFFLQSTDWLLLHTPVTMSNPHRKIKLPITTPAKRPEPKHPIRLKSIWQCPMLKKGINHEGNKEWTCLWCHHTFAGQNATRALAHVVGKSDLGGKSVVKIIKCPALDDGTMDQTSIVQYQSFLHMKMEQKKCDRNYSHQQRNNLAQEVLEISDHPEPKRRKHFQSSHRSTHQPFFSSTTSSTPPSTQMSGLTDSTSADPKKSKTHTQSYLASTSRIMHVQERAIHRETGEMYAPDAEEKLSNCIAKFIFELGLPFSTCESKHLLLIISLSKHVSSTYKPPTRNNLATNYLSKLHTNYKEKGKQKLLDEANIFGLSVMGDGATIKRKPLFNVMMSGIHEPCFVASVKDCSKDLAKGQDKTGEYLSQKYICDMEEIDPNRKLFDCVMFDGGSNFQKAGRLMKIQYPRLNVIHGCEHVLDLYFKDIVKIPEIDRLIKMYRLVNNMFGGRRHRPHSIFKRHTKEILGKEMGLLQVAGTRMAGYYYAMLRAHQLKVPLRRSVEDKNFLSCNLSGQNQQITKKLKTEVIRIIENNYFFDAIKILVKALFPVVKCLRLSDCNKPGMDKIYYFLRETKHRLAHSADGFNNALLFNTDPISVQPEDFDEDNEDDIDLMVSDSRKRNNKKGKAKLKQPSPGNNSSSDEDSNRNNDKRCMAAKKPSSMFGADDSDDSSSDSEDREKLVKDVRLVCDRHPDDFNDEDLSRRIYLPFAKRMGTMASDMAVAGWLLCVEPRIFQDAKDHCTNAHLRALRRVAKNLLDHDGNTKENLDVNVTAFMEQFQHFRDKRGVYSDPSIWTSNLAVTGQSHLWHKLNSWSENFQLGHVACRVTSKGLGIGPCERQWGDVKQMCSGKRSAISSERLEKQAVLFGNHSICRARIKRNIYGNDHVWGPDDLAKENLFAEMDECDSVSEELLPVHPRDITRTHFTHDSFRRTFAAYQEDWEQKCIDTKSPENERSLLKKHRNLRYVDPENQEAHLICDNKLRWVHQKNGSSKKTDCKGYALIIIPKHEEFISEDIDNYEVVWFTDMEEAHTCIGVCDQEPHIEVRAIDGSLVDKLNFFKENFQDKLDAETHFKDWNDY